MFIFLLLIAVFCTDSAFGQRSRDRSRSRGDLVLNAGGLAALYGPNDWLYIFKSTACGSDGFTWTDELGGLALASCASGDYFDCDVSSSPATASGIGVDLNNKGLVMKSTSGGWEDESITHASVSADTDFHIRILAKFAAGTDYVLRWDGPGAHEYRVRFLAGPTIEVLTYANNSYTASANAAAYGTGVMLIDIVYDADDGTTNCAGAGCTHTKVYVNGDALSTTAHTSKHTGGFGADGGMALLSSSTCPTGGANDVTLYWLSRRLGSYSEAQHAADAVLMGL